MRDREGNELRAALWHVPSRSQSLDPKARKPITMLQFRIKVQASIQEHIWHQLWTALFHVLWAFCVSLLGSPPTVWKPDTSSFVLQPGGQAVSPHLEAQSPSVALDHSSSGVAFPPGYSILRCWPLGNLYMMQNFAVVFWEFFWWFLIFRMKQAVAKRYGTVAEFILSI